MNFIFLFSLINTLSFSVKYELTNDVIQDFFVFQSKLHYAHFYRNGSTLLLKLTEDINKFQSYTHELGDKEVFNFAWDNFTIDGISMKLNNSNSQIERELISFEDYIFMHPYVELNQINELECKIQPTYILKVNYFLISVIVLVSFITIKVARYLMKLCIKRCL